MKRSIVLVWCAALLAGCGITVTPKRVPSSAGTDAVSFAGAVVIVANAEQDAGEYAVKDDKGGNTPVVVNRMRWSKLLVEALAGELAKRGAKVRADAPAALSVSLPDIAFSQFGEHFQFKVTAAVAAASGWSRQYDGIAETKPGPVETTDEMAARLAGDALAKVIKAMLRDEDFVAQVRNPPRPKRRSIGDPMTTQPH